MGIILGAVVLVLLAIFFPGAIKALQPPDRGDQPRDHKGRFGSFDD